MTYAAKKKRNNTTLMDFIRKDEEKKIGGDAKAIAMELSNSSK
ncbi:MAG: hypothetical protein QW326_01935 [Fervidicoccaceae archaeon]